MTFPFLSVHTMTSAPEAHSVTDEPAEMKMSGVWVIAGGDRRVRYRVRMPGQSPVSIVCEKVSVPTVSVSSSEREKP